MFHSPKKPIRENYPNRPKTHKLKNLALIAQAKKTIRINNGVSSVYTFLHAYFEGVDFYAAMQYFILKKDGREEYFFVNDEE